jgi:replicative DNA helicase
MTNARSQKGTGAIISMPDGHAHTTAPGGNRDLLHAEDAFIGALPHLPVATAGEALALVHDDDLADPLNQQILGVARALVAEGIPPDPVAVFARARADGVVSGADAICRLSLRLADLYAGCPTPASWRYYGTAVIDEALRRRCLELAARVTQAAEGSPLDVLIDVLDAECRTVRRLDDRRAAVEPTQLRAVAG